MNYYIQKGYGRKINNAVSLHSDLTRTMYLLANYNLLAKDD